jgi:transcriptional regulator NrdR family protein
MAYSSVACPHCSAPVTKIVSTNSRTDGGYARKRECQKCRKQFVTYEISSQDMRILRELRKWQHESIFERPDAGDTGV